MAKEKNDSANADVAAEFEAFGAAMCRTGMSILKDIAENRVPDKHKAVEDAVKIYTAINGGKNHAE